MTAWARMATAGMERRGLSFGERERTRLADGSDVRVREKGILSFASEQLGEGFAIYGQEED